MAQPQPLGGRSFGLICLCIFLIFWGLATLFGLHFNGEDAVLGFLAAAAGVLLLIGR